MFSLKNRTQNVVEKLVPESFIKNQNWAYIWINSLKCYKVCFYCMSKSRSPKIYEKEVSDQLYLLYIRLFKNKTKQKEVYGTIILIWPSFIAWLSLLLEIMGTMCLVIIFCPVCGVINFEIERRFLIKAFIYLTKKSGQRYVYLKTEKSF